MIHICMTGTLKLMDDLNPQQITDTEFRKELISDRKHFTLMRNSYTLVMTFFLLFSCFLLFVCDDLEF